MLSFLRSDFRIGQAASYDLVITEWTLFASTSMSSFEEGTGTGRKICLFNFYSNLSTYLFQHVQQTLRNILACFRILLLTWNLKYMWSEDYGTLLTCQPNTRSHAHRFTKVKPRTSSRNLVLNVGLLPTLQKFRSAQTQYASRSCPREFISEDTHIVWCAFASIPKLCSYFEFIRIRVRISNLSMCRISETVRIWAGPGPLFGSRRPWLERGAKEAKYCSSSSIVTR